MEDLQRLGHAADTSARPPTSLGSGYGFAASHFCAPTGVRAGSRPSGAFPSFADRGRIRLRGDSCDRRRPAGHRVRRGDRAGRRLVVPGQRSGGLGAPAGERDRRPHARDRARLVRLATAAPVDGARAADRRDLARRPVAAAAGLPPGGLPLRAPLCAGGSCADRRAGDRDDPARGAVADVPELRLRSVRRGCRATC